ncbi:hypothetical protein C8R48DRAFT_767568 [Suillus tomentosus]|nr:hypothetical protein C8R48DRAFT_767568 [Suillus tomentosus]
MSSPPPPLLVSVPKSRPKSKLAATTTHAIRASSKTTPVPGLAISTKGKTSDPPTAALAPSQLVPGPLTVQKAYIKIWISSKCKIVAIKEEASENKDDDKNTYLTGSVSGLTNILQMIEMTYITIRKEMEKIDRQVSKCHCCHH